MPLPFASLSHGIIPFGFFNIKTDMLLLDKYAFFSTEFCTLIRKILTNRSSNYNWKVFKFDYKGDIGNLHGAIAGKVHEGFIGNVYSLFPFPTNLNLFKQTTYGYKTQKVILPLIKQYTKETNISVKLELEVFSFGEYRFTLQVFKQLLDYIIVGGYPRWENKIIPDYIKEMIANINSSKRVSKK